MLLHVEPRFPWFALYVKSRHEKHVAASLTAKDYECFLPTYWNIHRKDRRFAIPLFPGYLFCRVDSRNTARIVSTPGLFSIVGGPKGPEPVPDTEIETIRRMISSGRAVEPYPYVSPGQAVYITDGPFRGVSGTVVDSKNVRWLVVSVHLLQRSVAVKLDKASLSPAGVWAPSTSGTFVDDAQPV